jgi:pimeloyl-ACP methyl ester carboxylesterase
VNTETCRYHLIVPSLPGYAFSSPPATDREFSLVDIAYLFDKLMLGLGFDEYMAQGGDVGSMVSVQLAREHPACKSESTSPGPTFGYSSGLYGHDRPVFAYQRHIGSLITSSRPRQLYADPDASRRDARESTNE